MPSKKPAPAAKPSLDMQDFSVAGLDDVDPPVEAGAGVVLRDFTVADVDEDLSLIHI